MRLTLKVIAVILVLALAHVVHVCIHEAGHAVTALAAGCRINQIQIHGLQVYPEIENISAPQLRSSISHSRVSEAWHGALIRLMGSGSTVIAAYIGALLLFAIKPRGLKRLALILVSLYTCDIMLYTVEPMLITDSWIGYWGSYPEPFMAASELGVPEGLFYVFAVASFLVSCCLVALYIIRHTGKKIKVA